VIGAVILAAGAGSRMGRDKATLRIGPGGPTFVDKIEKTLEEAGVDAVRVVVAPGRTRPSRHAVVNPNPAAGMLSSIHCGLHAFEDELDALLIWPVDHPSVTTATVVAIIDAYRDEGSPIVVPTYQGRRGHPVLFAASTFRELIAADPSQGARAVVHAHTDRLELAVDDPGVVADIDTPEDYARLMSGQPL
jgi:molybdenum cofactor cytidylyltransferase